MATPGLQVLVSFPPGVPLDAQGTCLLQFEQDLRELTGLDIRVVKQLKGDDSKLRVMMTKEMRDKL